MKPTARFAFLVVAFTLSLLAYRAAPNFAQESATKGETVLKAETRMIEVNVVAQDSKGRAVKDLTRDDFELFDNGKEVPIDVFAAEFAEPTSPTATIATLPPNTFTNRIQGVPPSVTVILLDGLNTTYEDQTWARTEVIRFLENLQPQNRVAIFMLGDHLYVLQNFTNDPKLLLSKLKNTNMRIPMELIASQPPADAIESTSASTITGMTQRPGGGGAAGAAGSVAAIEGRLKQQVKHERDLLLRMRIIRTADALAFIADYLKQFPGRKNLIWVSAGFPISIGFDAPGGPGDTSDQVLFTSETERASKALNNADMAIYPVNARGLVAQPGTRAGVDWNNFYSTEATAVALAEHTGGRAFFNTNDIAQAMRVAVDDAQADYTLGFYPQNVAWDGRYHELKVKVARPGVHLRYRQGYLAALDNWQDEERSNALIQRALDSPLDTTGLGLTVTLEKDDNTPAKQAVLRIMVDPRNIRFQGNNGSKTFALEMVIAQSSADGKMLNSARGDVNMPVPGSDMDRLLDQGLRLKQVVDLVEGATTLELVVRDPGSGNIGSVRIPLGG